MRDEGIYNVLGYAIVKSITYWLKLVLILIFLNAIEKSVLDQYLLRCMVMAAKSTSLICTIATTAMAFYRGVRGSVILLTRFNQDGSRKGRRTEE